MADQTDNTGIYGILAAYMYVDCFSIDEL